MIKIKKKQAEKVKDIPPKINENLTNLKLEIYLENTRRFANYCRYLL